MDQSNKETLKKVIGLIKEGDTESAIPILATILKSDPNLHQAWYLLGLALDDQEDKRRAFERVLKLDPTHEKAIIQLQKLEDLQDSPEEPPFAIETDSDQEPDLSTGPLAHDDFELPDWMQDNSFDPSEYASEGPDLSVQPVYENTDEDIPDWAQPPQEVMDEEEDSEIFPTSPEAVEQDEEDFEPTPAPFEEEESELTGYYDVEEEEETPDWLTEDPEEEGPSPAERVSAFFAEEEELEDSSEAVDQPEWLRDMVEDDGNGKKRKKREKVPKKILSPDQKRRIRKIITTTFMLLMLVGLVAGGYYYRDEIKPYVEPYYSPVLTRAAPVTELLTQGAPLTLLLTPDYNITPSPTMTPPRQPTSEPTWTPSAGGSAGGNQSSGQLTEGAPTVLPTPIPIPDEIVSEMEVIEEQIESVRNLPGPLNVEREMMPGAKLRQVMEGDLLDEEAIAFLRNEEIVLRALGFIDDNYDLTQALLNTRGDSLGGYYDEDENKINMIGSSFTGIERVIYAHEYTHAVQDANFDLNRVGLYPSCAGTIQACLAVRALVEGDVSLTVQLWLEQYPPEEGAEDILEFQPPPALFQDEVEPAYFTMNTFFAYVYGPSFVEFLYEDGGWTRVNRAYGFQPDTTEQILHPEKYQQGDPPIFLSHPDLTSVFGGDWELIRRDSLGEWESYLLLAYNDFPEARRLEDEAQAAAAGWGDDQYWVYYDPTNNDVFLSVYWIWETTEDADEFFDSLLASTSARFGTNEVEGPGESGRCFSLTQQVSCIYQNQEHVLWLYSDNAETLEAAKEKFTKFP